MNPQPPHISIAPMMDWTDRHCRYFHRLLSPHVRLYTEMVTTGTLLHGDAARYLTYNPEEHYVALQLGGSEPDDLATCAKMGADYGYDEINLNCGCPSERVQKGAFGACLMAEPDTVARGVESMTRAVKTPISVKCRIGIDNCESEPFLRKFITSVSNAGCQIFVIHARQAWLKGLSPKENRDIPPLDYDLVARMKLEFPHLQIILNGAIKDIPKMHSLLKSKNYDGLMIGREAYQNPSILLDIERDVFGNTNTKTAQDVVAAMVPYIEQQGKDFGVPMKSITRHMIGLFNGKRGSRAWRRTLSVDTHKDGAKPDILLDALKHIRD